MQMRQILFSILYGICIIIFIIVSYACGVFFKLDRELGDEPMLHTAGYLDTCFRNTHEKNVVRTGSIEDYHHVVDSLRNSKNQKYPAWLFFSMVMADFYNYPEANIDAYNAIIDTYKIGGIDIDENSMNLALHYLEKGAKLGNVKCKEEIQNLRYK